MVGGLMPRGSAQHLDRHCLPCINVTISVLFVRIIYLNRLNMAQLISRLATYYQGHVD